MEEEAPPAEPRSQRFVLWLHGLGDSGRANESVAGYAFAGARWAFPTEPTAPVTCNRGMLMPSWFDIHDTPITSISAGTRPEDVFVFGLSQGGALSIASVPLYPKTLGGCAVFSGFLPFRSSFASRVTDEAKKTPVLWVHGRADFLVPIEAGKDGIKFLWGRLGMSCEFKVYDGLGHELAPYKLLYGERWADGGGGGSGEQVQGTSVDPGVPRSRGSCSCGFNFFSWS
ncbi:hypothetical protein VPH35_032585 [Triticum aestivum]